jgi:phosphoribosylaminoimidazolecarboxamide formyltransferase/IMP cyclohydrolase
MKKRALLSVSDKTGILDLAHALIEQGYELVSTGGTARLLVEAGLPVTAVQDITGFPECLDGRVKTLHPAVHAGILAMRDNPQHMATLTELAIAPIDMVAINLYPFKATIQKPGVSFEEAVENIDIGGPTMLRAAAKNWKDVAVVCRPEDYALVIDELRAGGITRETRLMLARRVFEHTAAYDALIADYLRRQSDGDPFIEDITLTYSLRQPMRYGENPHQRAGFYTEVDAPAGTLAHAVQLQGKALSYNNIGDAAGALDLLKELGPDTPCAVAVKHANPCGVGLGADIFAAYKAAHDADPVSIFGGIVALNRPVDADTARELSKIFLEIVIAPGFTPEAREILAAKKNWRLLELPGCADPYPKGTLDLKRVAGGLLVQELDRELYHQPELKVVTKRAPTEEEMQDLRLAMQVVKHVKSNGIVLVKNGQSVGIGPGQTNRITALELAIKYAGERSQGAVMGSDAFFPFDDCVRAAHAAGVTAIIQPGGSLRDSDSIKFCDEVGMAMVFTGMRHFKH